MKKYKPSVATLPWKAIMAVADLKASVENGKYKDQQPWYKFVNPEKNLDSLARHVGEYCSGDRTDKESGLPISTHIALRALMQLELDIRGKDAE
jgi:hypothetical protein